MLGWDISVGILVRVAKEGDFKDLRRSEGASHAHTGCRNPRQNAHQLQSTKVEMSGMLEEKPGGPAGAE